MGKGEFVFLDKQRLDKYLPDLFRILHSNMSLIAPTDNSYSTDYEIWSSCIIPAMEKEPRQIVLMYAEEKLVGYFQYYINENTHSFVMEEIQIVKEYQKTGIFSELYKWLLLRLPENIIDVQAYANKKNRKSQGILKHLGLVESGENKNSNSFYYRGKYADLSAKYK